MKVTDWINKNIKVIKNILIALGVIILLLSFISNWVQSDRYKKIKEERKELKKEKEFIALKYRMLTDSFNVLERKNKELQLRSDSIKKVSDKAIADMKKKEQDYLNTIADLSSIPIDTVYKKIFVYNPNTSYDELNYRFGSNQIRFFYAEHISLNYNKALVVDLNNVYSLCKTDNKIKSSIIVNKDGQIGTLNEKLKLNEGLITNLTEDNKLLNKAYKSERFWKGAWRIGALTISGLYVYQTLK
jgi:hypothetical protein